VNKKAKKYDLANIETIQTNSNTNLEENSVDIILLIDVLHNLNQWLENIQEFYRVIKEKGVLWVDDHHYDGEKIKNKIIQTNLFKFSGKFDSLYKFIRKS
jgi:ubiquinone/menaquinone biosynthesis C-methylase UbiE